MSGKRRICRCIPLIPTIPKIPRAKAVQLNLILRRSRLRARRRVALLLRKDPGDLEDQLDERKKQDLPPVPLIPMIPRILFKAVALDDPVPCVIGAKPR